MSKDVIRMSFPTTNYAVHTANVDMDIYRYLEAKGIRHAYAGYRYLITAIRLGLEDRSQIIKITDLYEKIAQVCGVRASRIERTIRYSIMQYGLTNKEFISKAIDDLVYGIMYNGNVSSMQSEYSARIACGSNAEE